MIARGRVVVEADGGGGSRLACLRSEGPIVLRPTAGSLVHMVGGAGGPLGGDDLRIEVVVGAGAVLTLRTVAASVVQPGPSPLPSVVEVDASVGEGGVLHWLPEPTVAATGCRHQSRARVVLADGARLVWREELVGGRHGERGGSVSSRLTVDRAGRPLLRHRIDVGPEHPSWSSPAVGAGARCVGSVLVVDPAWLDAPTRPVVLADTDADGTAAMLPLAGPAVHVVALAPDARTLRRLLDAGQAALVVA